MLTVSNLSKSFATTPALVQVTFDVAAGETVALLGPSGCGKSTLLSLVAGLQAPDEGEIRWDGRSLHGVPPHQRSFGLMFQDYALFPHLNVFENVAFGLHMLHLPTGEIKSTVEKALNLVGLPDAARRDVNTLSGGEQQRVALARSLAPQPRLLMLDEPLGSLDRNLRERLTGELRHILRQMAQTALYVTHDLEEAFALADRIVLMHAGRIEQIGAPQALYRHPATPFVARFLGLTNLLQGQVNDGRVKTPVGTFLAPHQPEGPCTVLVRPDAANLAGGPYNICGTVAGQLFRGSYVEVTISAGTTHLTFDVRGAVPAVGEAITVYFDAGESIQFLPFQELL
ncbi:MAG: ABC transporter ATP-binding protein [Chloroflexota bacterium]